MFDPALVKLAERLAERLIARGETIALVETASGGLASAALLAVPGASAYFVGSAVAYSRKSRHALLSLSGSDVAGLEPMSDGMGIAFARRARTRMEADWGLAELGIAGPAGSPYGGPAGVALVAASGPVDLARRIETGSADRPGNMQRFAEALLELGLAAVAD